MSQNQHRFCLSTVRTLKKLKHAVPFLNPVDPIALGIPHYPTVVKQPMDLSTVERKLISSNPSKPDPAVMRPPYFSTDEFISDVKLIFNNCAIFNGPEHLITQMGRHLEAVFDKQLKQLPANEEVCLLSISCTIFDLKFTSLPNQRQFHLRLLLKSLLSHDEPPPQYLPYDVLSLTSRVDRNAKFILLPRKIYRTLMCHGRLVE